MAKVEAEPTEARSPESDAGPEKEPGDESLQLLFRHLAEITSHASRLSRLRAARWKIRTTWAVSAVLLGLIATLVVIATALAGVWLVFRGLPPTLALVLGGNEGLADLVSGLILLAGIGAFVLIVRSRIERGILHDLEEHDEREEPAD